MILLKKPYTPIVYTTEVKTFNVYGISFRNVTGVYLSGSAYENQTFYNPFSAQPKLSAQYPGFYGIKLSPTQYTSNNVNTVTFTIPSASFASFVDVIVENPAGYGSLTQYVVKYRYNNELTQKELRPWSEGIEVKAINQIYTIDDDILITIAGENIITIDGAAPPLPVETYHLITDQGYVIITDTIDRVVYGT